MHYFSMQRWETTGGSLANLHLTTGDIPRPSSPGDVLIEVEYVGLNFADICACLGLYSATPEGVFTPGLEFSGIVAELYDEESNPEENRAFNKVGLFVLSNR